MPHSDQQGKDVALGWYRQIAPRAVIDVGAGSGTYARLMRTDRMTEAGRIWTAIEAWEPYIAEYKLREIYDQVFVNDARDMGPWAFHTDLVIFGDVLEHMTQDEARKVLATAQQHAANIIVSIPVLHLDQGAVNGNPYETHIDHWTYEQMRELLNDGIVKSWWGDVLAYFWWAKR